MQQEDCIDQQVKVYLYNNSTFTDIYLFCMYKKQHFCKLAC